MADEKERPIIIIRKKVSHGGHHGGAWKVAYADFVTAMMALFIVLWLLNTSEEVQQAIGAYFRDPSGAGQMKGSAQAGSGETLSLAVDDMDGLKDRLDQALKQSPQFDDLQDYVQMSVTGEGLRVEMLESETGMFFQSGSPAPSKQGEVVIHKLAEELGQLPNDIVIEGHTDARPFGSRANYTNWELSTDRANSARRLMETSGLRPGQVVQVRGFADHNLRDPQDPEAASNRRISVIVRYQSPPGPGAEPASGAEKEAGGPARTEGEAHGAEAASEDAGPGGEEEDGQ